MDEKPKVVRSSDIEDRKTACQTFIEQTKLLTSLASAFIIAPAVVHQLLKLTISWQIIIAEILFVLSVLFGYIALGAITGTQNSGEYDVYRKAVMNSGRLQFLTYVIGISLFGYWFIVVNG